MRFLQIFGQFFVLFFGVGHIEMKLNLEVFYFCDEALVDQMAEQSVLSAFDIQLCEVPVINTTTFQEFFAIPQADLNSWAGRRVMKRACRIAVGYKAGLFVLV